METEQVPAGVRIGIIEVAAAALLGLLLALLGPFGTFAIAGPAERVAYWLALTLIAWAIYKPAYVWSRRLARKLALPTTAVRVGLILISSFPMTLIVWLASFRHTPSLWPGPLQFIDMYGKVVVIGGLMIVLLWSINRMVATPAGPQRVPVASAHPPFFADVPPHLHGILLALEMEDHYLRVHTDEGSSLILLRMRDAVSQLSPTQGAQVHRSWWVAREAVSEVRRNGKRTTLMLTNGLEVPVSRDRLAELRQSEFLK